LPDIAQFLHKLSVYAIPVILAITFHEAAHGWVAYKKGDATAKMLGRVTLNPFPHIDPFGTILLPAMMLLLGTGMVFGWAKPVPVNFRLLRDQKRDPIYVAAAGSSRTSPLPPSRDSSSASSSPSTRPCCSRR